MPTSTRPLETWSTVSASLASTAGARYVTGDTIVPHKVHGEPLSKLIPGAHLTLLPGVGHMPQHVAAPAVLAAIDRAAARAGLR